MLTVRLFTFPTAAFSRFFFSCSILSFSSNKDTLISWSSSYFLTDSTLFVTLLWAPLSAELIRNSERERRMKSSAERCDFCSSWYCLYFSSFPEIFASTVLRRSSCCEPLLDTTRSIWLSFARALNALYNLRSSLRDCDYSSLFLVSESTFSRFASMDFSNFPFIIFFFFWVSSSERSWILDFALCQLCSWSFRALLSAESALSTFRNCSRCCCCCSCL